MADIIHAKKTETGETEYRIWSTVVDAYVTKPLTRAQIKELLVSEAVIRAMREAEERLVRVDEHATSSRMRPRSFTDDWDKDGTPS